MSALRHVMRHVLLSPKGRGGWKRAGRGGRGERGGGGNETGVDLLCLGGCGLIGTAVAHAQAGWLLGHIP